MPALAARVPLNSFRQFVLSLQRVFTSGCELCGQRCCASAKPYKRIIPVCVARSHGLLHDVAIVLCSGHTVCVRGWAKSDKSAMALDVWRRLYPRLRLLPRRCEGVATSSFAHGWSSSSVMACSVILVGRILLLLLSTEPLLFFSTCSCVNVLYSFLCVQ